MKVCSKVPRFLYRPGYYSHGGEAGCLACRSSNGGQFLMIPRTKRSHAPC